MKSSKQNKNQKSLDLSERREWEKVGKCDIERRRGLWSSWFISLWVEIWWFCELSSREGLSLLVVRGGRKRRMRRRLICTIEMKRLDWHSHSSDTTIRDQVGSIVGFEIAMSSVNDYIFPSSDIKRADVCEVPIIVLTTTHPVCTWGHDIGVLKLPGEGQTPFGGGSARRHWHFRPLPCCTVAWFLFELKEGPIFFCTWGERKRRKRGWKEIDLHLQRM